MTATIIEPAPGHCPICARRLIGTDGRMHCPVCDFPSMEAA